MTVSITRCWKKLKQQLLLLASLLLLAQAGLCHAADGIVAQRLQLEAQDGALSVASRYRITLPAMLQQALQQGVPLTCRLTFELTRPRSSAYWLQLSRWFDPTASLSFKLSHYGLTGRYRVTIGGLSKNYASLDEALAAVGSIAGWKVMDIADWSPAEQQQLRGRLRLELDLGQLPRPFQLNALGADDWAMDSGWNSIAPSGGN